MICRAHDGNRLADEGHAFLGRDIVDGRTVGLGAHGEQIGAIDGAATGHVIDHDGRLSGQRLAEPGREEARPDVCPPADAKGNGPFDVTGHLDILRLGSAGQPQAGDRHPEQSGFLESPEREARRCSLVDFHGITPSVL